MLQIQTNQLNTRKRVEIDGHPYTVRRLGAGEQLALSQLMRKMEVIQKRVEADGYEENEEDAVQAESISQQLLDLFVRSFDDGGDGSKSRELINSLDPVEVQDILTRIFAEDAPDGADQAPEQPAATKAA